MECKIVIFLPLAGGLSRDKKDKEERGGETVAGMYCDENGRAAFSRGWITITNNVAW